MMIADLLRRGLIAVAISLTLSSCATKVCGPYKYLRFDGDGSEVTRQLQPSLSGLTGVGTIPAVYEMERGAYRLRFSLDETSYMPAVHVDALLDDAPSQLRISGGVPRNNEGQACFSYRQIDEHKLLFSWLDRTGCEAHQSIGVEILSRSGKVDWRGPIAFSVESQGEYCVPDGL